jgi:EAL domain-containing protein (putative c-di-GMP-specific phosphodiesterase class I)
MLETILEPGTLGVEFEPLLELRDAGRRVHGVECLVRGPRGTNLEPTGVLLEYARRKHEEPRVDRACALAALEAARHVPDALRVFLNVHASTLERDPEFVPFLADEADARSIRLGRLALELNEHGGPWIGPGFREALDTLRHIGVSLALDDVGRGHAGYRLIADSRPAYLKVDGSFVRGCRSDYYRLAVLESLQSLAQRVGSRVVATGMEDEADLVALRGLGVDLFQGRLVAPPILADQLEASGAFPELPDAGGGSATAPWRAFAWTDPGDPPAASPAPRA